jgi:hypothetical protein
MKGVEFGYPKRVAVPKSLYIAQNIHSLERDGALSRKYELHIHREIFSRMCTQTMKPERCLFNYRRRCETGMCCAFLTEACR